MPVSKNKRKNHISAAAREQKKKRRLTRENHALKILGKGLDELNRIRNNIRQMARMYVDVTKQIPGYQETNPEVQIGLTKAIPILKEVNERYDALLLQVKRLAENPPSAQLEYVDEVGEMEALYYLLGHDFMDHFIPVIEAIEKLGERKGIDQEIVADVRQAADAMKPKLTTVTE